MAINHINENLQMLFSKMEEFISTKTVVGEPVYLGDVIIIPLVDVSFGMGTGLGGGGADKEGDNGIGGGAMGAKITPAAVVVVMNGTVQLVNVKNQESVNKLIDMIPGVLSKLNLVSFFSKKDKKPESSEAEPFEVK